MFARSSLKERCHIILEEKGGEIADRARAILLEEEALRGLQHPLQYTSEKWRDPLTPSLVVLSCEAVRGKPEDSTRQAALGLVLMSLSFNLWDDIVDNTKHRIFVPTTLGRFGEGVTLMIGGLASAKAFSILNKMNVDQTSRHIVTELVWSYWKMLAKAETANLELRSRVDVKPDEKLKVIEMQAVNLETALKIGAVLGAGSEEEMTRLGNYGRYLGTTLELIKDFKVSVNLTLELGERIRSGALTYNLLWAKKQSKQLETYLSHPSEPISPVDVGEVVEAMLETRALENTLGLFEKLTEKADVELSGLKSNSSIEALKFFLKAQPKLFVESLSTLL